MTKTAHFDCTSGISGDMCLGALSACLGAEEGPRTLRRALARLPLKGYKIEASEVRRAGFGALKVDVKLTDGHKHAPARRYSDIRKLLADSKLSASLKSISLAAFKRLFEAEARVHGDSSWQRAHLHELGAVDAIVDIVGSFALVQALGISKVTSSAIELGSGTVKTEHGVLPVPAPATAELLRGVPVTSGAQGFEATTPTGALIITSLAESYGPMPGMNLAAIGVGAGGKDPAGRANVLRVFMGNIRDQEASGSSQEAMVIETNIDDMEGQVYEHVLDLLFEAGALDAFLTPVIMKKSRPGVLLSVLCDPSHAKALQDIILSETTTLGLRAYPVARAVLGRRFISLPTPYGRIRIKVAEGDKVFKYAPEYEDLKAAARKYRIPLRVVRAEAMRLAAARLKATSN